MSQYKFKINGKDFDVTVNGIENNVAAVSVNGIEYNVELDSTAIQGQVSASVGGVAPETHATLGTVRGGTVSGANGRVERSETVSGTTPSNAPVGGTGKKIVSPLPGVIIDVCVNVGDAVKRGQKIAVIEAMKMENDILAECDGTVSAIYVKKTDSVLEGADIASIA
ncbi:MAG: acetyl-CoA carboxylase biotin carboxyl carrier protein subunit [Bacteroidales bacterium]|nr:acetyl-CoA carboxylase biotin carboxyl carrier protein subunit [Bacteroidales bacterium]